MTEEMYKPGERLIAMVDGVETKVVFSLETEEKGDRRDYCFRYDQPYFPLVPKDTKVVVTGRQKREFVNCPDAGKLLTLSK
jgi:hypothetical protein